MAKAPSTEFIPGPVRSVLRNIEQRRSGSKPGVFRALVPSIAIGVAVGVATYKLQRRDS